MTTDVSTLVPAAMTVDTRVRSRNRRRRLLIRLCQLTLVVVFTGGWEIAVRAKWLDEFTYGRP
ncbi:MAG: hypothetical protein ACJ8J3_00995, partial [Burkholderia ambifaria]